jgi:hypothetical protein
MLYRMLFFALSLVLAVAEVFLAFFFPSKGAFSLSCVGDILRQGCPLYVVWGHIEAPLVAKLPPFPSGINEGELSVLNMNRVRRPLWGWREREGEGPGGRGVHCNNGVHGGEVTPKITILETRGLSAHFSHQCLGVIKGCCCGL